MVWILFLQSLKQHIQRGLEIIVILSGPAVLDHIHDHFKVLLLRGCLMKQIEDEGGVQGDLGPFPKWITVGRIFGGRIFDEVVYQLHNILIIPQIGKGIEGVGVVGVDQVKDLDDIAFFQ